MGFHVVNILLHGGISILTLDVFSVLFGGLQYTSKGRRVHLAPRASLLAALLFAVHPVHTECVSIPHVRQSACVWDVCVPSGVPKWALRMFLVVTEHTSQCFQGIHDTFPVRYLTQWVSGSENPLFMGK